MITLIYFGMRGTLFVATAFLLLLSPVLAEQVIVQLKDEAGTLFGTATAYITFEKQSPGTYLVKVQGQRYGVQELVNFVGTATANVELRNPASGVLFVDGASVPNKEETATGDFPLMSFTLTPPPDAASAIVRYKIIGSGNLPSYNNRIATTVSGQTTARFDISPTKPQTSDTKIDAREDKETDEENEPPEPPEQDCTCTCHEVCEHKPIRDCPVLQRSEGKISKYATSGKIAGGYWKGGVVLENKQFLGDCAGCADIQKVTAKAANCDEGCKTACENIRANAVTAAVQAAQACFNQFADGCAQTTLSAETPPVQVSPNVFVRAWAAFANWFRSWF